MIGKSKDGNSIIIGVTDHLSWEKDVSSHVDKLINKLNVIIDYILGGQIEEKYPNWKENEIEIRLMFQYQPTKEANAIIEDLESKIKRLIANSKIVISVG